MNTETILHLVLWLIVLGLVAMYAGLVLIAYWASGPQLPPTLSRRDPARSLLNLSVWVGVKAFAGIVTLAKRTFDLLAEASADIGEKFIRRRGGEV